MCRLTDGFGESQSQRAGAGHSNGAGAGQVRARYGLFHGGEGLRGLLVLCALWLTLAPGLRGEGSGEGSVAVIIINSGIWVWYTARGVAHGLISCAFKRYFFFSLSKLHFCAYVLLTSFPMGYATAMAKGTGSGVVCPASRSKSINRSIFSGKVKMVEPLPDLQLYHLSN